MTAISEIHAFFAFQPTSTEDPLGTTADQLLEYMSAVLLPVLESLGLGLAGAGSSLLKHLADFDSWTLRLASADWKTWSQSMVPRITRSTEWEAISRAFLAVIRAASATSFLDHNQVRWLTEVLWFYFDFAAVFAEHLVSIDSVARISDLVLHARPGYRFRDPRERFSSSAGAPDSAETVVELSRSIEQFGRNAAGYEDLTRVELMFTGWTDDVTSASQAILDDQISFSLCPNLVTIFTSMRWNPGRDGRLRVGITLIDFCTQRFRHLDMAEARHALAVIWYGTDVGIVSPPVDFDVGFLKDDSVPWGLGIGLHPGPAFGILRLPTVVLLEDFLAHELEGEVGFDEFSLDRLGGSGRAFGRLVGLCIVHDSDVFYLRLPLGVVKMLHPRLRMRVRMREDFIAQLGTTSVDTFAPFLGGVEDALGPGGFYMFSTGEWVRLFSYIPDAAELRIQIALQDVGSSHNE